MGALNIMTIPADGIGKEVIPLATDFLSTLVDDVEFTQYEAGYEYWCETNMSIEPIIWDDLPKFDGILFGCTATPSPPPKGYSSPILQLRKKLQLSVNIRHCKTFSGANTPMDVMMVRNATEGLYSGVERREEGVAVADYIVSRTETLKLAEAAVKLCKQRGGKVTIVHKANVLKADAYFREICIETLEKHNVEWDESLADAAGYFLVEHPSKYDVMIMTSHVGDILSDVGAAVVGGLGLVPSLSLGSEQPLAEPIHGAALDIVNTNKANPIAAILSGAMLLDSLGKNSVLPRVQAALSNALSCGLLHDNSTSEEIIEALTQSIENM